ncbi:MAG TPA: hypothetical protein VFY87_11615 [Geminicoccaceae bacterium]|nr:hypothetical protein [Geminicoccaceae bacterium]
MAILDNADRATIDVRKFKEYLLNPSSEKGAHKARVFQAALGYTRLNCLDLIEAIRQGIMTNDAVFVREDRYGRHYRVEMTITGPKGSALVATGWIFDRGGDVPRLTTAFVP